MYIFTEIRASSLFLLLYLALTKNEIQRREKIGVRPSVQYMYNTQVY